MGKIGDLFVRLGLTSDNFKKGIRNAQQEVQNFGKKLGNMKAGALAAWAAIGTAVTKVGKDFISATNKMNDAWEATMAKMKAEYHAFLAAMSNTNFGIDTSGSGNKVVNAIKNEVQWWKKLFGTVREAGAAAKEMADAFDAEFELTQSIRLQRAAIQEELNQLYAKMRDTSASNEARQAAQARYRALLQPIADAEIAVYQDMMNKAIAGWQAGTGLSRTADEIIEFFTYIGTKAQEMAAKFPDIYDVFQNKKGDSTNLPIFDVIAKFQQASNQMSNVEKEMARTTNSINANIKNALEGIAAAVKTYGQEELKLELDIELDPEELNWDELNEGIMAFATNLKDNLSSEYAEIEGLNQMLESTFISSFSGAANAIAEAAMGVEGAGFEQVMAAVLQPIAQTATQLGEMLIAEGIAISAFKESLKSLNPVVAIAAGTALIAVGAALSAGIKALGSSGSGTTTTSSAASTTPAAVQYDQELTIRVEGEISGDKIVIAGQKSLNKWNRG